ncbi:MAG: hypothetical protein RIT14_2873 [Pseudomonadota bacterium]|jgi:GT2 family glycosyltransferase
MPPDAPPPRAAARPAISVIICTRDRPDKVMACLGSLALAARAIDAGVEVLVLENGSPPPQALSEAALAAQSGGRARLIRLSQGNLSAARNVGMARARGQLLVFVDDDCLLEPDYLTQALRHWRGAAGPFLIGGRVRLDDPTDLPFTIRDDPQPHAFDIHTHPGGFIPGCNFIVTRETALAIGWFDTRFGAGAKFRAGEDTDYTIRAFGAGVAVRYVPDMAVRHAHGRKTFADIDRLNRDYAFANGAILAKHLLRHPWLARHLVWTMRAAVMERLGGPGFDTRIGLTWGSVSDGQIKGALAYLADVLRPKGRSPAPKAAAG